MKECVCIHNQLDLKPGDYAELTKELTQETVVLFAIVSDDVNPAHLDEEYAATTPFKTVIGHGAWTSALISAVLGTQLPGPGTIYMSQRVEFKRPVRIGEKVTARVTVMTADTMTRVATLRTEAFNQDGKLVVTGEAVVLLPAGKVCRKVVKLPEVRLF